MPQSLEHLLADVPLFEDLDDEALALIAGCGQNVHFAESEYIFRDGEAADSFFLIRHGIVALEAFVPARGPVVIETLEPGEVLGWSWLFPPYRWHFDARVVEPVRATAFDGVCLRGKCDDDPRLGYRLMGRFAQIAIGRLQSTRLRLLDVYGNGNSR
jgi:CRP/FNR family transcriptional regulator, cyclic AMP receptor protein